MMYIPHPTPGAVNILLFFARQVRYTTMAASTLLLDEDTMELTNSEAVFTTLHDMDISYLNSGASNGEAPVVIW